MFTLNTSPNVSRGQKERLGQKNNLKPPKHIYKKLIKSTTQSNPCSLRSLASDEKKLYFITLQEGTSNEN